MLLLVEPVEGVVSLGLWRCKWDTGGILGGSEHLKLSAFSLSHTHIPIPQSSGPLRPCGSWWCRVLAFRGNLRSSSRPWLDYSAWPDLSVEQSSTQCSSKTHCRALCIARMLVFAIVGCLCSFSAVFWFTLTGTVLSSLQPLREQPEPSCVLPNNGNALPKDQHAQAFHHITLSTPGGSN